MRGDWKSLKMESALKMGKRDDVPAENVRWGWRRWRDEPDEAKGREDKQRGSAGSGK